MVSVCFLRGLRSTIRCLTMLMLMTILKMSYTLEFVSPTCIPQRRSADSIAASTLIPKNLIVLWQAKRHQEIRWSERGGAPNDGRRKKKRRAKRHSASFGYESNVFAFLGHVPGGHSLGCGIQSVCAGHGACCCSRGNKFFIFHFHVSRKLLGGVRSAQYYKG